MRSGLRGDYLPPTTRCHPYDAFTPDTCSPDTSCIHLYPLSPSIVTATCFHLYPRVEHCLELCIRHNMHPSTWYPDTTCSYPATCICCKRGLKLKAAFTPDTVAGYEYPGRATCIRIQADTTTSGYNLYPGNIVSGVNAALRTKGRFPLPEFTGRVHGPS